jgi:hypothetical protein
MEKSSYLYNICKKKRIRENESKMPTTTRSKMTITNLEKERE